MRAFTLAETTPLERKILSLIRSRSGLASWRRFPDGEIALRVAAPGVAAVVLGRTAATEDAFRTLLLVDTLRRSGARRITLVIPYFGYSRHDRQARSGDDAAFLCLLEAFVAAGATRIVTVDPHNPGARSRARVLMLGVSVAPLFAARLRRSLPPHARVVVVAPDAGARGRAAVLAAALGVRSVAWVEKRRDPRTGRLTTGRLHGTLQGDVAVLCDDLAATGETAARAARLLRRHGIRRVVLCVSHAVFGPGAARTLRAAGIDAVLTTTTIGPNAEADRMRTLFRIDPAEAIARAIRRA